MCTGINTSTYNHTTQKYYSNHKHYNTTKHILTQTHNYSFTTPGRSRAQNTTRTHIFRHARTYQYTYIYVHVFVSVSVQIFRQIHIYIHLFAQQHKHIDVILILTSFTLYQHYLPTTYHILVLVWRQYTPLSIHLSSVSLIFDWLHFTTSTFHNNQLISSLTSTIVTCTNTK